MPSTTTVQEVWKVIPRTHQRYSVSILGNVRNNVSGKLLNPYDNGQGYLQVNFQVEVTKGNWKRKGMLVHRLVLEAFVGAPDKARPEVNHKDENKLNNSLVNLEYVSRSKSLPKGCANRQRKAVVATFDDGSKVTYQAIKDAAREGYNLGGISRSIKTGGRHKGGVWSYA